MPDTFSKEVKIFIQDLREKNLSEDSNGASLRFPEELK